MRGRCAFQSASAASESALPSSVGAASVVRRVSRRNFPGPEPLGELHLEHDDAPAHAVVTEPARDGLGVHDDGGPRHGVVADVLGERVLLAVRLAPRDRARRRAYPRPAASARRCSVAAPAKRRRRAGSAAARSAMVRMPARSSVARVHGAHAPEPADRERIEERPHAGRPAPRADRRASRRRSRASRSSLPARCRPTRRARSQLRTRSFSSRPIASGGPKSCRDAVTSMNASSSDSGSTSGLTLSKTAANLRAHPAILRHVAAQEHGVGTERARLARSASRSGRRRRAPRRTPRRRRRASTCRRR